MEKFGTGFDKLVTIVANSMNPSADPRAASKIVTFSPAATSLPAAASPAAPAPMMRISRDILALTRMGERADQSPRNVGHWICIARRVASSA
jgi:hypothetical protein